MIRVGLLVIALVVFLSACDGLPIGKPSTSAPRTDDPGEHMDRCSERLDAIYEWEEREKRKLEDEWIDGERGIWQSMAKVERIQEEAREMRYALQENCNNSYMEKWGFRQ